MPAKTSIEEILHSLRLKSVQKNLDHYALGLLFFEQAHYRKEKQKKQGQLKLRLREFSLGSPENEELQRTLTKAEQDNLDLGFYFTIQRLDELSDKYPEQARLMMHTILGFDKLGRYVLSDEPIILDGRAFSLCDVLQKHGINLQKYARIAQQNCANTAFLQDEVEDLTQASAKASAFSFPENMMSFDESTRHSLNRLSSYESAARKSQSIYIALDNMALDFSLISQAVTDAAIKECLLTWAELFEHAKMQDCSKLDTINATGSKRTFRQHYSQVAFLQEKLCHWLLLSLSDASRVEVLQQRLAFIMAMIQSMNYKRTRSCIPVNVSADMYLPLVMFASIILKSPLKNHPLILENQDLLESLKACYTPERIKRYLDALPAPLSRGGKKGTSLSPMRMCMTRIIALAKEMSSMATHASEEKRHQASAQLKLQFGSALQNYFNPARSDALYPIRVMSNSARRLLQTQAQVALISNEVQVFDFYDCLQATFPFFKSDMALEERLKVLSHALLNHNPRILFEDEQQRLIACEGADALLFMSERIEQIKHDAQSLHEEPMVDCITTWCETLTRRLDDLKHKELPVTSVPVSKQGMVDWVHWTLFRPDGSKVSTFPAQPVLLSSFNA